MRPASDELRTRRLLLNRITVDDAALTLAVWNDPDFIRFVGDRGIRTEEESVHALETGALKLWEEKGYGPYRVSRHDDGEAMGICGLFKRENLDDPDIGYGLLAQFCGSGYAFEAAAAVKDHARDKMKLSAISAIVSPDNPRSIHLLKKLGMSKQGPIRMPDEDEDILLYGLDFS